MSDLTQEELKRLLHYDPETGVFTWRVIKGWVRAGAIAGGINSLGYQQIKINRRNHRGHRLAFLYMTGSWPVADVDHIDGNKSNNRWDNLRPATRSQNNANSKIRSSNSAGYKGVTYCKRDNRWRAAIRKDGRHYHLGHFDTAAEAYAAYLIKARQIFGPYMRRK
jgi:predicted ribonuclease toxin of YeeF-YezG toxin-antitoxin module